MDIKKELKEQGTEVIVRLLAQKENFGQKMTPYNIQRLINKENPDIKYYSQKIDRILSLLAFGSEDIFGYEKVKTGFSFYWIKVDMDTFKKWFKEWFQKEY